MRGAARLVLNTTAGCALLGAVDPLRVGERRIVGRGGCGGASPLASGFVERAEALKETIGELGRALVRVRQTADAIERLRAFIMGRAFPGRGEEVQPGMELAHILFHVKEA